MASTQRFFRLIEHREVVRHEEGIELGAFEFLDEGFEMLEVEVRIWVCAWVAPCARVEGHWAHEGCEMELFLGCHFLDRTGELGAFVFYHMALIEMMKSVLPSKTWLTNAVGEVLDHDIVLSGVC
jgi:hypothetical protein